MTLRLTQCFRSLTISDALRSGHIKTNIHASVGQCRDPSSSLRALPSFFPLRSFSVVSRLDFHLDPVLFGAPMKKKRKIDPALLARREEKIRGKIGAALGRLGKFSGKLKPIDEYQVPRVLIKEREIRQRALEPLSFEESEKRAKLRREYDVYTRQLFRQDKLKIMRVMAAQKKALQELKAVNEDLYLKAIEVDEGLLELTSPMITSTPPIAGYEAPDGQHDDVTKTFEYDVDFMAVLEANTFRSKPKWQLKQEEKERMAALEDDDDDKKKTKKKKEKVDSGPPPLNP